MGTELPVSYSHIPKKITSEHFIKGFYLVPDNYVP